MGRNVIALVVVLVLGIICGGYILSQQRFTVPWEARTFVYATFDEAPALAPGRGQEVRMAGVPVGDIRESELDEQGHAKVLLAIDKNLYADPVYDNATVVLRPKSPLNEMYIEMDPGTPQGHALPDYGVLPLGRAKAPVQVDAALSHLDTNTLAAVQSLLEASDVALANAPEDLPGGLAATDEVVKNLKPVVEQLDTRRERLAGLVTSVSQLSTALGGDDARLTDLANSLQTTLKAVSDQSVALRDSLNQLPGVVDQLGSATGSVQQLSDQLDPTLDNVLAATETLPGSLNRLTDTVETLDTTVDKARPVAEKLKPFAADLRPFVADLNGSMPDLQSISGRLDPVTAGLVQYLPDLEAFVYQTASVTSMQDANGGILRGLLQFGDATLPIPGASELSPTPR
ncbi:MlaD family protein [Pseudonocardia sp. RS11V-5]|uniref:MlaD family protein n=1 Tax=Pseudonocardia terrae TaxID=2905831 RepID=UPI001E3CFD68|nr:MlaD family protein [Pseudonocardia terrae]MCE3552856.1 MlaD family protein [Pseudonocardia terrae]